MKLKELIFSYPSNGGSKNERGLHTHTVAVKRLLSKERALKAIRAFYNSNLNVNIKSKCSSIKYSVD